MISISKALPLKFWLNGDISYNNWAVDGIDEYCYVHKIQCDDPIRLQFTDLVDPDYSLKMMDCDGNVIDTVPFIKTSIGGSPEVEEVPGETVDLVFPALVDWTTIDDTPNLYQYIDFAFVAGRTYQITATFEVLTEGPICQGTIRILNADGDIIFAQIGNHTGAGFHTTIINFVATEECSRIMIFTYPTADIAFSEIEGTETTPTIPGVPAVPPDYSIYDLSFVPTDYALCNKCIVFHIVDADGEMVAFTDEIKVMTYVFKSNLFSYKSSFDFAGIKYDEDSEYFSIRIPSIFYHETTPLVTKSMDLSNARTITTASSKKKQRLLSISDMPDYMHETFTEVLMHAVSGSLLSDGKEWVLESGFEEDGARPNSYPMRPAKIVLTKKSGFVQNII